MLRNVCLLLSCGALAACTTTRLDPVVVTDQAVPLPVIEPLSLSPVHWRVLPVTPKQKEALFALDTDGFNCLELNLVELRRYLEDQKSVIQMLDDINKQRAGAAANAGSSDPGKKAQAS